jgi:flavin-dependent dehydrogenase
MSSTLGYKRYRQPRALSTIVTKIHPADEFLQGFAQRIHAFLPSIPQIEFGAVTPKGDHLTVNIAGAAISASWMDRFLEMPAVRRVLPPRGEWLPPAAEGETNVLRYFKGRFPISLARHTCGDRYIILGDAAGLVRPFKGKGVNSACISGIAAARTMMTRGIARGALQDAFATDPRLKAILDDMFYGSLVRRLAIVGTRYGFLDHVIDLARREPLLRRALFDSVSALQPYREIVLRTLRPGLVLKLARVAGASLFRLKPRTGTAVRTDAP